MFKKLGKYELIEEVGRGAMGQVYKAYDPLIGRLVALKTITHSLIGNPDLQERFYWEARAAGTLQHPNIVTVYELAREGSTPFIAMEFLEGEALEKIVSRRAELSIAEKVGLIVPVCRALDYAHKRGFVHRDIKPGNVMVTKDGNVKVVDFGIARFGDSSKTETNMLIGTLSYMSPQQIKGEKADERADIWALGVSFYELLCYRRPFEAQNQATLMLNIVDALTLPAAMSEILPGCPAVEAIVMKLLRKDIEQRFQTMEEVLIEIEPVWKNLQEESVAGLIRDADKLIEAQEFTRARDLLRKCLAIDGRNERAKVLVEHINAEIKQNRVLFQVKAVIARARDLLDKRRYSEAEAEAEAALKIDPTSLEARQLQAEVNRLAEKTRLAQLGLQAAKKCMAEGELTRAALEVEKVLQMEASNLQARALQQQIQDFANRREERRHVEDTLQQARKLWAELRFDECISLLTSAEERFPGEKEIEKLLETVKQDQAEQDKQEKLVQLRGLLAEQRADDALGIVQSLVAQHPNDPAVLTAHRLVLRESENLRQKEKFRRETAELRKLMDEGEFSDAVSRGEKLLLEFPQEAELIELVSYAREESGHSQRQRNLEAALADIREKIRVEQYRDAVIAAEIALARFPHDPSLKAALQETTTKQKEKDKRELFQRRIEQIQGNINRGQYTDAVDLARQTLSTLGRNDQVSGLLRSGETELAEKRRQQEQHQREPTGATQGLSLLVKTQAAARIVRDGLVRLYHRRPRNGSDAALDATLHAEQSLEIQQSPPTNADPAKDYVFLQGTGPTQTALPTDGAGALRSISLAPMISGRSNPEIAMADTVPITELQLEQPVGIVRAAPNVYVDACRRFSWQTWRHASEAVKDQPILCGILVSLIVCGLGTYFFTSSRPVKKAQFKVQAVDTKDEIELFNRAQQLEEQKHWPEAQATYENLARRKHALAGPGREGSDRLRGFLQQENSLLGQAKAQLGVGDFSAAKDLYERVVALHGDKEQEATDALEEIIAATATARKRGAPKEPVLHQAPTINEHPAVKKQPAQPEAENCKLISTDISIYLDRADSDRARGNYIDAERLYGDVLACDSKNDRAHVGLDRSRQAKALPNRLN